MGTSMAIGLGLAQLQAQRTAAPECPQQHQTGRIATGALALVRLLPRPVAQGVPLAAVQAGSLSAGEPTAAWLNSQRLQAYSTRRPERVDGRARAMRWVAAEASRPAPAWLD